MSADLDNIEHFLRFPTWTATDAIPLLLEISPDSLDPSDDIDGTDIEPEARALIEWLWRYGLLPRSTDVPLDSLPEPVRSYLSRMADVRHAPSEWIAAAKANPAAPAKWLDDLHARLDSIVGNNPAYKGETKHANGGAGLKVKHEWMQKAWDIGKAWMLAEEKRINRRPTVEQIAKYLEGELSNKGITGGRGIFLDWETIKRQALTGITERVKGDNFRNTKGNPQRKKSFPIVKGQ